MDSEHKLEPYQIMDGDYCRPLLRVSSENYAYLQGHVSRNNSEFGLTPEFLARDAPINADEEESDFNLEEDLALRNNVKGTEPKESLIIQLNVGIMQVLTTNYGTLQLLATKKEQKLRFSYDENSKELFNNKVELFQYIPSQNKSTVKE